MEESKEPLEEGKIHLGKRRGPEVTRIAGAAREKKA